MKQADSEGKRPPAAPRPAATLVVAREATDGPEVLLLRRARSAGFMPNAYVFPGGLVDDGDGSSTMVELWEGLAPEEAQSRLGLHSASLPPAIAYFGAAVRETFEETGLLLGCRRAGPRESDPQGHGVAPAAEDATAAAVAKAREALLAGGRSFARILEELGMRLDGPAFAYVAHWVTPPSVARRYDTRFFACMAPPGARATTDEREAERATWLTPARALALRAEGSLTMIFPTASTLEDCLGLETAADLVSHLRQRPAVHRAPARPLPEERKALGLPGG